MNTEDERRDKQVARLAARSLVHVDGDIITANGSLCSGDGPPSSTPAIGVMEAIQSSNDDFKDPDQNRNPLTAVNSLAQSGSGDEADTLSVCSCSCYQWPDFYHRRRKRLDKADIEQKALTSSNNVAPVISADKADNGNHTQKRDYSTISGTVHNTPVYISDTQSVPPLEYIHGSQPAGNDRLISDDKGLSERRWSYD